MIPACFRQLVRTKVRFAESLQTQDTLEAILDYYEAWFWKVFMIKPHKHGPCRVS